jgi:hypothetical protein
MALEHCQKCGAEVGKFFVGCAACSNPVSPASRRRAPEPQQGRSKTPFSLVAIVILSLLIAGLFVACSPSDSKGPAAKSEVVEAVDLKTLEAKAEGGDAGAQKRLGVIYAKGQGVKQDYAQAAKWYRKAADQGHAGAQIALGELYEVGRGVPHDVAQAAKWYRQAAEQGNAAGQYSLAVRYVMGQGVPRDDAAALKWYRLAADQGDALAQFNLGMRYYEGHGVAPDPVEAYQWLSLAAAQGIPDAVQARDDLKRKMTREQINEGRRRTDAFVVKKPSQVR